MSHKNRSEDIHKGSSKNSRRGYHRRRGSDGAYYELTMNILEIRRAQVKAVHFVITNIVEELKTKLM